MTDTTERTTQEWWAEIDALKAQLAAKPAPPSVWAPDTRTIVVCWMAMSTFAIIVMMLYGKVPDNNQALTMALGAYISTGFGTVLNWWFSSSKGSDEKTQALVANQKDTK